MSFVALHLYNCVPPFRGTQVQTFGRCTYGFRTCLSPNTFSCMFRTLSLLGGLCVWVSLALGQTPPQPDVYRKATLLLDAQHTLQDLARQGVEVDHGHLEAKAFTSVFSTQDLTRLAAAGFSYRILIADVAADFEAKRQQAEARSGGGSAAPLADVITPTCDNLKVRAVPQNFKLGSMGGHLTYAEVLAELDSMRSKYPTLITAKAAVDSITTQNGRPILWVRIAQQADVDDSTKPEALFTGLHHAREPISMHQLIYFMWYLLENYATDPEIAGMVNNAQLYFIPVLNPDGYVHNQLTNPNGGGMWRKNRRINGDGTFGVDLNRNYGYAWGVDNVGSTGTPGFETYRGPAAFSEPETQAMRSFCSKRRFSLCLNYHTFSNVLIYPYGYANTSTQDSATFRNLAKELTKESHFAHGTSLETLFYPANGSSDDYLYTPAPGKPKIMALTPEVGEDFWPQRDQILPQILRCQYQNIAAVKALHPRAIFKDTTGLFLREGYGTNVTPQRIKYKLKRVGTSLQTAATFTLTFRPIGADHGNNASITQTYSTLGLNEELVDSVLIPEGPIGTSNGNRLAWQVSLNNGYYSELDTVYHFDGIPQSASYLQDKCDAMHRWSGAWMVDTTQQAEGLGCLSDSRGNYPAPAFNYANNFLTRTEAFPLTPTTWAAAELSFLTQYSIRPFFDAANIEVNTTEATTGWQSICTDNTHTSSRRHVQSMGMVPNDEMLSIWDGHKPFWSVERIDLQPYITNGVMPGSELFIRFNLNAKPTTFFGSVSQGYDGIYVDDIRIRYVERGVVTDNLPNLTKAPGLHFYPNPMRQTLLVEATLALPIYLVDALGKVVARATPMANSSIIFNTDRLPAGVYTLKQGTFTGRVVKGE